MPEIPQKSASWVYNCCIQCWDFSFLCFPGAVYSLSSFVYNFASTSSDKKHHTCLDYYITPLGSESFIINFQAAFREEYLNSLVDGVQRRPLCSWAYGMFLQERSSRTQEYLQDERLIWSEGYAVTKFTSITGGAFLFFVYHSAIAISHFLSFSDHLHHYDVIFTTFLLLMLGGSYPNLCSLYKLEVLRDAESEIRSLL
jgi:hypothetical protein